MVICARCGEQNNNGLDENEGWIPILGYEDRDNLKADDRRNVRLLRYNKEDDFSLTICLCQNCKIIKPNGIKTVEVVDSVVSRFEHISKTLENEALEIPKPKSKKRGRPKKRE